MATMSRTVILLCLAVAPAFGLWEKDLRSTFDVNPFNVGKTSYMPMPETKTKAIAAGWEEVTKPTVPSGYGVLELLCKPEVKDRSLCWYYDDTGYVAGYLVALFAKNVVDPVFDMQEAGYQWWTFTEDGVTTECWTMSLYFVTPEELAVDAATRVASRDDTIIVQNNVVMPTYNGSMIIVPKDEPTSTLTSLGFIKQGCFVGMGTHYYYQMTESFKCTVRNFLPWFVLVYNNQLVGIGFSLAANYTVPDGGLNVFETPTKPVIKVIVPHASDCYYNFGDSGMVTNHMYFIKDAHLISCMW